MLPGESGAGPGAPFSVPITMAQTAVALGLLDQAQVFGVKLHDREVSVM